MKTVLKWWRILQVKFLAKVEHKTVHAFLDDLKTEVYFKIGNTEQWCEYKEYSDAFDEFLDEYLQGK